MLWFTPCSKEFKIQFCLQRCCCHAHVSLKDPTKSIKVAAYDQEHSWVLISYRQSMQRNARKARYSGLRILTLTSHFSLHEITFSLGVNGSFIVYFNANSIDFKEVSPV